MRPLLALAVLTAASVAHADARQDIVDMRHHRMPNHTEALGWTEDGAFVLRRTGCAVHYNDEAGDRRRVAIVLSSGGHWRPLRVISSIEMDSNQFMRSAPRIDQVERSPDGTSLAIVTTLPFVDSDFYFDCHGLDVVENPDP